MCRGFRLPASRVIHTVGPIYDADRRPEVSLRSAYRSVCSLWWRFREPHVCILSAWLVGHMISKLPPLRAGAVWVLLKKMGFSTSPFLRYRVVFMGTFDQWIEQERRISLSVMASDKKLSLLQLPLQGGLPDFHIWSQEFLEWLQRGDIQLELPFWKIIIRNADVSSVLRDFPSSMPPFLPCCSLPVEKFAPLSWDPTLPGAFDLQIWLWLLEPTNGSSFW